MSLLLDALKRAEQDKTSRGGGDGLALVDDGPVQESDSEQASPAPASPATAEDARASAQALFAAKQAGLGEPPSAAGRRKAVVAGFAVGALVLLAIGAAYVWLETSGGVPLAKAPPTRPPLVAPTPAPPPSPAGPSPTQAVPPSPVVTPNPAALPLAPGATSSRSPGPAQDAAAAPAAPAGTTAAAPVQTPARRVAASARPEAAEAPHFTPEADAPRVPAKVAAGYEALRAGDARQAQTLYREAIAADPASVDAHLGLAAASAKADDRATAARHYRETLALDPSNASAVAGLAALSDFTRADALEAQLRADVARFPANAGLRFTLGGLYAEQSRWNEAQAAYFEAYRLDPENPDLAFNLAVSLEHLGKPRLAADFYERALNGAGSRGAQFDRAQAARRLSEIRR